MKLRGFKAYLAFKNKWAAKRTYNSDFAGIIKVYRNDNFTSNSGIYICADVWHLPTWHGWGGDEKLRAKFMRELKNAGLIRVKGKKLEYYAHIISGY